MVVFHTIKEGCGVFFKINIIGQVWLIVLEWGFQGGIWCVVNSISLRREMVAF